MSDILSTITLIIVLVFAVILLFLFDFVDFVYSVGDFFDRRRETIRKRRNERKLKYFYNKYKITVAYLPLYIHVLNYCFPAKNLRYRLWQLRKEIKQSLKSSAKADKSFVEKIIRLKYETHVVATNRKIDQTLALSSNRMKHMMGVEEAAQRTADLLTLTQLGQLVEHNIDAHTYVVMREQGYDFNTILKWANMPQEWVDRLEPKNSEKSNRYDFITTS